MEEEETTGLIGLRVALTKQGTYPVLWIPQVLTSVSHSVWQPRAGLTLCPGKWGPLPANIYHGNFSGVRPSKPALTVTP